jgi:alpha-amylase
VGNFDHVFEEHLQDVYQPFLQQAVDGDLFPLTLHLSGPLLDWLETHHPAYLDLIGRLVADGKLELLLAGYYEPILPSLLREDRVEQIVWLREALQQRFGADAKGLWLTERAWEPDLPEDLVDAGVEYVLVDDRHFVAAGFPRDALHQPFRTEAGGKSMGIFAIDERLRYFLPFHGPEDTMAYLRDLRSAGRRLAVAADDIEKFGGWPGTKAWVYDEGWMDRFIRAVKAMEEEGEIKLATFGQAMADLPSGGPVYLPSSSYREMEEWSLPPEGFHRLEQLKTALGSMGMADGESPLIRGSHWRNFLVKYPESNRMHKKAMALSQLCRERGDPPAARRAIGAAQCNDVYWHGVFGGLYLRHLRDAIWQKLAEAEGMLREGEDLICEEVDLDLDGNRELWVHSASFSAVVSPARGGVLEELTLFGHRVNLANTLTRRREAYHERKAGDGETDEPTAHHGGDEGPHEQDTAPSIHDLEETLLFKELPPIDLDDRALFLDRVLPRDLDPESYHNGAFKPVKSWAARALKILSVEEGEGPDPTNERALPARWLEICLGDMPEEHLEKRIRFSADGTVEVLYNWDPTAFPTDTNFASELSLGAEADVLTVPEATVWRFPISTFSKSERGFDETIQGESVTVSWPVESGWGRIRLKRK